MKNIFIILSLLILNVFSTVEAQHTFSIVGVDPVTGEVGSAGATCIDDDDCNGCGGAVIISGLIPGRGAINAQAYVCIPNINLTNGLTEMESGKSPDEVLEYLMNNDACQSGNFNPQFRQYGIADLDGNNAPGATAFTGSSADNYKGHIIGANYAIQGNILIGAQVLEQMEAGFINTEGSLASKLMAALQGANIPGADFRCFNEGVSSRSSYIRVARPNDTDDNYYLELIVSKTPDGKEPIDSLQTLFDQWGLASNINDISNSLIVNVFPNPSNDFFNFEIEENLLSGTIEFYNTVGQLVYTKIFDTPTFQVSTKELGIRNIIFYQVKNTSGEILKRGKLISH